MARKRKRSTPRFITALYSGLIDLAKRPIVLAWVFTLCSLTVLTALSVPKLRAAHPAPSDITITFNHVPDWLDDSLLNELRDVAREHLANEPIARDGLISVSTALAQTGWFEEVNQVSWTSNSNAEVDASFLIPFAKVDSGKQTYFVDAYGKRLPTRIGNTVKNDYHFITLKQLSYPAPLRPGMQWEGDDVIASLKLLQFFYNYKWATQIDSLNLSKFVGKQVILFTTKTPSQFIWGSPPNQEKALEALAIQKLERLTKAHETFGAIDQGVSGQFDLTDPNSFIRK